MTVRIDAMAPEDLPRAASIVGRLELFQRYDFTAAAAQQQLAAALTDPARNDLRVARAAVDAQVTGFAWLVRRGAFDRSAYLRLIAVDPEVAGRGTGRSLMSALEADHLEPTGIVLMVNEANAVARSFYESLGYACVGRIPAYVRAGETECVYWRRRRTQ